MPRLVARVLVSSALLNLNFQTTEGLSDNTVKDDTNATYYDDDEQQQDDDTTATRWRSAANDFDDDEDAFH